MKAYGLIAGLRNMRLSVLVTVALSFISHGIFAKKHHRQLAVVEETQKIVALSGYDGDYFGYSVTVNTDKVIAVGVYGKSGSKGAVLVYEHRETWTGFAAWLQLGRATPRETVVAGDQFGFSVALDGSTLVASSPGKGAVYIFERVKGALRSTWKQKQELAEDSPGDAFGHAVAIVNGTLVISSVSTKNESGSVYVYEMDSVSDTYVLKTKLSHTIPTNSTTDDGFGTALAISSQGVIVVGAPKTGRKVNGTVVSAGAVYFYAKSDAGVYRMAEKVTPKVATADAAFGQAVAIDGPNVVVGAISDNSAAASRSGAVYVLEEHVSNHNNKKGIHWHQKAKLVASGATEMGSFGRAVSIEGDTIIVTSGANNDNGAAYIFVKDCSVDVNDGWVAKDKLVARNGAAGDIFGSAVSMAGGTIVIGASQGTANFRNTEDQQGSSHIFSYAAPSKMPNCNSQK